MALRKKAAILVLLLCSLENPASCVESESNLHSVYGSWEMVANGYHGTMNLGDRDSTIQFEAGTEKITDISFDGKKIEFYRNSNYGSEYSQSYTGELSGEAMTGTFIQLNLPGEIFHWSAERKNDAEDQLALPTCPIGTDGAPNLRDPGIASVAQCRGACGEDCPSDRCDPVEHIVIPITDAQGQQYNCVYNNVISCLTHQGCRDHDACYDKCAETGESSLFGPCHIECNRECFVKWGDAQCNAWADYAGYVGDYWIDPDFDGVMLFSDPPELIGPIGP
ncbi:MAG: hypothetical protein LUP94_00630 [Candidatus Methanomethylicus sp.]|jgi:hypothetical protein|nr:hypothetical protein [Candidatus Methanomethylicus sp.]